MDTYSVLSNVIKEIMMPGVDSARLSGGGGAPGGEGLALDVITKF